MRGTTTNHIRTIYLAVKIWEMQKKYRQFLPQMNSNRMNGRTSSHYTYPNSVMCSNYGGAEMKMIRGGEE
jgi:hypothetical protein